MTCERSSQGLEHISNECRVQLLTSKLIPIATPLGHTPFRQNSWQVTYQMAEQSPVSLTWECRTGVSRRTIDAELWNIIRYRYQRTREKPTGQRIAIDDQFFILLGRLQIPRQTHLRYYLNRLAQTTYSVTANGIAGNEWHLGNYVESRGTAYFEISPLICRVLDHAQDSEPADLAFYTSLKSPRARRLYCVLESIHPSVTGKWQHHMPIKELIDILGIYTFQENTYKPSVLTSPTWNIVQRVLSRSTEELLDRGYLTSFTCPGQYLQRVAHFTGGHS